MATNKDNMFLALKTGAPVTKMQYIKSSVLQYEREWMGGFSGKSWIAHRENRPAGTLHYVTQTGQAVPGFTLSEWGTQLRFAPGERPYNSRKGKTSQKNLSKEAPIFRLSHQLTVKGVGGGDFTSNFTELTAQKLWRTVMCR